MFVVVRGIASIREIHISRLQYENLLRFPSEVPPRPLHCFRFHALIEAISEDWDRNRKQFPFVISY